MTVYPNINASLDCFSKEKCSPLLVPSLYTLLTMEWLQLWVCHCVFFTEWELAVMISMSPPCMPVVDHNSLYSPWNLHWEHLMVPRTTMLAAKPTVLFTFLWAWPSLCYWGKRRLSNRTIYDPAWFWPWASWNAIAQKNVETSWMEACLYLWRHELISLFWITLEYFAQKIWLFCSKLLHRMDPVQHAWVFLSIYFVVWPQIFLWHELFLLFLSSWCSTDLADSVWFVWVVWLNSVFTGGACLVFIGQFMSDFFFPLLLPKSFVFCSSSC